MANQIESNDLPDSSLDEGGTPHMVEIGAILHDQAAGLLALLQVLKRGIESMSPNPFDRKGEPTPEEVDEVLAEPVSRLSQSLNELVTLARGGLKDRNIAERWWEEVVELNSRLMDYGDTVRGVSFRPPFLYLLARKLADLLSDLKGAKLPKEKVREIQRRAKEVERIVCLYDFSVGRARILSMDYQIRTLREFLMTSVRPQEPRRPARLQDIIRSVIHDLEAFSAEKRVKFEVKFGPSPVVVEISETDVRRALLNILHNAIKYSWQLPGQKRAWVKIQCYVEGRYAHVEFESWGVPIMKDEIEQGLVFKLGYRGAFSGDKGRVGTGIGLYDALKTARAHGGDITVESKPAWSQGDSEVDMKRQPFLTTVTFRIPAYAGGAHNNSV
ncbi:MAG TPA: HAMP domain-containing sensor histidine kinase [Pyrinomonadaceae bacterium]|jgi:signal transduction histidine kinase|nr:HAMP domain-containing sensor histidine kinase [Pyrinomonadaceae bacterium]